MATLLLQAAGSALFGAFGPVGAAIGQAAGALAGAALDRSLIAGTKTVHGTPLSGARISGADEGTGINRLYGTMRIGGMLFWATRYEESVNVQRQGAKLSGPKVETYRYFANFALGLCEGEIAGIRRVWADGTEIDTTEIEMRIYRGSEDQPVDPLIEAKQGADNAPAYRGLAYVVFERLPLDDYGNRIPVLQFEVVRPVGLLERELRAITVIPGATEHGYDPSVVTEASGPGGKTNVNRNVLYAGNDWQASLDELQALCPRLEAVALVVTWFGTDLRAENCAIRPGVEASTRHDESKPWTVDGIAREAAYVVSQSEGNPAYGGTPDDASVVAAIRDIRNRGLKVVLYPFVMMDIPAGNALPDPYGGTSQPAYPWRGRITCSPAPGQPASVDRTDYARTQVVAFSGAAASGDFTVAGQSVSYSGGDFGYRRMILHYAHLAAAAGGVDGFVIGSEMRGLTQLRDGAGAFPFVEQLVDIANSVRSILGPDTALTYGADWSEYFGYHPADGTGDVYFHLDALWASPAIDAVGIDNYMPLSDWRDADLTAGNPDGFQTACDPQGLSSMIGSGEGFDWYYASGADRIARIRTPITDGLSGKPWVFRFKDIESWWANAHYDRVGGAESAAPTAWVPKAKPVWFTELGCPAVDKGANQPNVFPDPKSSESALPWFSTGARDDLMQRRFLEAHLEHWGGADAPQGMVDPARIFAWTWDARPYPAFPYQIDLWADGANWRTGHWLNGRLGTAPAAGVIAAILEDHGFASYNVDAALGDLGGYTQSDPASARTMLEPLLDALSIDVFETTDGVRFQSRGRRAAPALPIDVVADGEDQPLFEETRTEETSLSTEAIVDHYDPTNDYESATARSRRLTAANERQHRISLPATMDEAAATRAADLWLRQNWAARRSLRFAMSPSAVALEPGDAVELPDGPAGRFVVTRIDNGGFRDVTAEGFVSAPAAAIAADDRSAQASQAASAFAPMVDYLDLPILNGSDETAWARAGAFASPWRSLALSVSATTQDFGQRVVLDRPATIGVLAAPLPAGAPGRFSTLPIEVDLYSGSFASAAEISVLNGANVIAILCANGAWEVVQFVEAEEVSAGRWRLSRLLRAQAGTDDAMAAGAAAGSSVVALDDAVKPLGLREDEAGLELDWIAERLGALSANASPVAFVGGLRALTPLSPVHLAARRNSGGDIALGWVRRGRVNADSWLGADIPLAEASERYTVEILKDGATIRSADVTTPAFVYPATDELSDFGAAQSSLAFRVRQIGDRLAGIAAEAVLPV